MATYMRRRSSSITAVLQHAVLVREESFLEAEMKTAANSRPFDECTDISCRASWPAAASRSLRFEARVRKERGEDLLLGRGPRSRRPPAIRPRAPAHMLESSAK